MSFSSALRIGVLPAGQLRAVIAETNTRERQLQIERESYQIFLDELERLSDPNAKVGQIYEIAVPKIREFRASA